MEIVEKIHAEICGRGAVDILLRSFPDWTQEKRMEMIRDLIHETVAEQIADGVMDKLNYYAGGGRINELLFDHGKRYSGKGRTILNLGAGQKTFATYNHDLEICLDIREDANHHVLWDLNKYPWPVPENSMDIVMAFDILEHLDDMIKSMEEIHRVLKCNGVLHIHTSDWRKENAFTDPTHKRFGTPRMFDFFCPETDFGKNYGWYSRKAKFKKQMFRVDGSELYFKMTRLEVEE